MRIAVTGGIAEGKSTVLAEIASLGIPTLSADAVAREVLSTGQVQLEVGEALGLSLPLDRAELRARLGDPSARRDLNRIMHPHVWATISSFQHGAVEVPLLIEACLHPAFDQVWVVTCGVTEQRRRLTERLGDARLVDTLLATQLPTRAKIPFASVIVRTLGAPNLVSAYVREQCRFSFPP